MWQRTPDCRKWDIRITKRDKLTIFCHIRDIFSVGGADEKVVVVIFAATTSFFKNMLYDNFYTFFHEMFLKI